jgi:hypothetical protein
VELFGEESNLAVELFEGVPVVNRVIRARHLLAEWELGLFSSRDFARAPPAGGDGAPISGVEVALDEDQMIAPCDEAVLSVVLLKVILQQKRHVEYHGPGVAGLRLVQGEQDLRTNPRMDPAL